MGEKPRFGLFSLAPGARRPYNGRTASSVTNSVFPLLGPVIGPEKRNRLRPIRGAAVPAGAGEKGKTKIFIAAATTMDQKKNDSKKDKPFVHYAAGCSLAGLFVVAVVWLVLLLACFLTYFLGDKPRFHDPYFLLIRAREATVLCAAFGVPLLVIWEICHSRIQRKEQDRKNSQTDPSDPQICLPQESGGQSKAVSIADSPFLDLPAIVWTGCFLGLSIIVLVLGLTISLDQFVNVIRHGGVSLIDLAEDLVFLCCPAIFFPLLVFQRVWYLYHSKKRNEQDENDSKVYPLFGLGCVVAVIFIFLIIAMLAVIFDLSV
ncbi:MAG: hypothetical protein IJH68_10205 [Thermoguttaceae bacterium]|nr:hypothetical protein [Thermoguttaceae bacterium]